MATVFVPHIIFFPFFYFNVITLWNTQVSYIFRPVEHPYELILLVNDKTMFESFCFKQFQLVNCITICVIPKHICILVRYLETPAASDYPSHYTSSTESKQTKPSTEVRLQDVDDS